MSSQCSPAAYTPKAATSVMTSRPRLIQATRSGFRCHSQSVTIVTDWLWQRKPLRVAWINLGREVITLVAAFGVYAAGLHWLDMPNGAPVLSIELLPALAGYALAYFVFSRVLFYLSLIIRAKLEPAERLMIVRYEVITYAATLLAATIFVGAVVAWSFGAWILVGLVLTFLGLLLKQMIEEAISAEE